MDCVLCLIKLWLICAAITLPIVGYFLWRYGPYFVFNEAERPEE